MKNENLVIKSDVYEHVTARIVEAIERGVKHDVIAFLTNVGEHVGPDSRYIHLGMTSSDVLDTGIAVQMKQSAQHSGSVSGADRSTTKVRAAGVGSTLPSASVARTSNVWLPSPSIVYDCVPALHAP